MKQRFVILPLLLLLMSSTLFALQTAPGPPYQNPHPPVTPKDRERVALAELAVKSLLMTPVFSKERGALLGQPDVFLGLGTDCLQTPNCLNAKAQAIQLSDAIKNAYGVIKEIRHSHIIPSSIKHFLNAQENTDEAPMISPGMENAPPMALRNDEYTVHTYATPNDYEWYHLDVVIAEDKNGRMLFQRFYIFPMKTSEENLPPGAVC